MVAGPRKGWDEKMEWGGGQTMKGDGWKLSFVPSGCGGFAAAAAFASLAGGTMGGGAMGGFGGDGIGGSGAEGVGEGELVDGFFEEFLDLTEVIHVLVADEGDGAAVALGSGGAADTVDVVFYVVGHVVVDDQSDVVDVDAAGEDVGGDEHVGGSAFETEHDFVSLFLREVGVHLAAVDFHTQKGAVDLFYFLLLTREDDDALQVAFLENVL